MRSTTKRQLPFIIIVLGITALLLVSLFAGLYVLNKAAQNTTNQANTNTTNATTAVPATELVILHPGKTVTVDRFGVMLALTTIEVTDQTASATVLLLDPTTQATLGTVQFAKIGELQTSNNYMLRLVNATPASVQLLIGQLQS